MSEREQRAIGALSDFYFNLEAKSVEYKITASVFRSRY